jgi:hypothetical protein
MIMAIYTAHPRRHTRSLTPSRPLPRNNPRFHLRNQPNRPAPPHLARLALAHHGGRTAPHSTAQRSRGGRLPPPRGDTDASFFHSASLSIALGDPSPGNLPPSLLHGRARWSREMSNKPHRTFGSDDAIKYSLSAAGGSRAKKRYRTSIPSIYLALVYRSRLGAGMFLVRDRRLFPNCCGPDHEVLACLARLALRFFAQVPVSAVS